MEIDIKNFVWKSIIYRFGIPRIIVSDNEKQFDNDPFRDFCSKPGIKITNLPLATLRLTSK